MKNLFYLLLVVAVSITACKKGDTGPIGVTGAQGTNGVAGPAGKDGSVIWSGTVVPASSVGKEGDYYLNSTNDSLYGPKVVSGWGKAISLKGSKGDTGATGAAGTTGAAGAAGATGATGAAGAAGTTGAAGSQILSGDGAPALTLGVLGDYYLDKTNYVLYGPKYRVLLSTSWGAGLQLGAPVQTYLFTNPFNYCGSSAFGQLVIPFSSFNYSAVLAENSLSLVYLKYFACWFLANGTIGFGTAVLDTRYNFDNTGTGSLFVYMQKHNGTDWTSVVDFQTNSMVTEIKIIVVPAGKITTISAMTDKSYDKVMSVLSVK